MTSGDGGIKYIDKKRQVIRFIAMGYTYPEVAQRVGTSESVVNGIMKQVRKDMRYETTINLKEVVEQTLLMYDTMIKDAEQEYRSAVSAKDKAQYIRLMSDLQQTKLKILQKLGVLYEKPQEIDVMANIQKLTMKYNATYTKDVKEYNARAEKIGAEKVATPDPVEKEKEAEFIPA